MEGFCIGSFLKEKEKKGNAKQSNGSDGQSSVLVYENNGGGLVLNS